MQLGGQLLHALGKGVRCALEFVLGGLQLRQLLQFAVLFHRQGLAAAEIFQGFLRIQHGLIQSFGLGLAGGAVEGHRLLGFQLFVFALETIFLIAQRGAVGQGLECRRLDMGKVDGQTGHFEVFALEAVENRFQGFYPGVAVGDPDAFVAERQAEQLAVEQAHQAVYVGLGEFFAQARVAVVVGVVELLFHRLQAFVQITQALVQIFAGELPGLRQGTGQFVVGVLGCE
ncbi:hypothetical protein D3C84_452550 [compost metagenome]